VPRVRRPSGVRAADAGHPDGVWSRNPFQRGYWRHFGERGLELTGQVEFWCRRKAMMIETLRSSCGAFWCRSVDEYVEVI
jgi:hypothetical protein